MPTPVTLSRRNALLTLIALPVVSAPTRTSAQAAPAFAGRTVLIMVDSPDCVYCRRWERDVEQGYHASPEGKFAPLEKRDRRHPDLTGLKDLRYTPTFIFLQNGVERGRITGYPGADFFWGQIGELYRRHGLATQDDRIAPNRDIET